MDGIRILKTPWFEIYDNSKILMKIGETMTEHRMGEKELCKTLSYFIYEARIMELANDEDSQVKIDYKAILADHFENGHTVAHAKELQKEFGLNILVPPKSGL
jgi:hypothetical protein